jgi:cation diffusion facilitator family transporter
MTGHHHHHHEHEHDHGHPKGVRGVVREIFAPHSHDAADSIDSALESSAAGIRAVKISLLVLGLTAIAQVVIVALSGSIALAADTIHNFADALTSVPLWIAFALSTKAATRRYTYGFGRAEDIAGLFVVAMIALSAVIAGWEAIRRLIEPQQIEHVGWVAVAGLVGFLGNEWVALLRIRVGRRIGSAALIADGLHARTDGFTSLAVLIGAGGVALGFPLADPVVGLLITVAILVILRTAVRDVFRRLMDGVDPAYRHRRNRPGRTTRSASSAQCPHALDRPPSARRRRTRCRPGPQPRRRPPDRPRRRTRPHPCGTQARERPGPRVSRRSRGPRGRQGG